VTEDWNCEWPVLVIMGTGEVQAAPLLDASLDPPQQQLPVARLARRHIVERAVVEGDEAAVGQQRTCEERWEGVERVAGRVARAAPLAREAQQLVQCAEICSWRGLDQERRCGNLVAHRARLAHLQQPLPTRSLL
jgi:hypothetical protein